MPNTEEETPFFLENRICIFLKLGKFHKKMLSWNWATFCKLWKKNCFSNLKREDFNVQCSWKASDVEHKEGEVVSGVILLNGFAIGAIRIYGHWIPPPSPNAFFCDKANYNVLQRVHLQQNFYQLQNCNVFFCNNWNMASSVFVLRCLPESRSKVYRHVLFFPQPTCYWKWHSWQTSAL